MSSFESTPARRAIKYLLRPARHTPAFVWLQGAARAWDIRRKIWHEPEIDLVPLGLRPGEAAVDIGACYGLYSFHMAQAVGPRGRVYAFEPLPDNLAIFEHVATLLRLTNVERIERACGDKAAHLELTVPLGEENEALAGIVHLGQRNDQRDGQAEHARPRREKRVPCEVVRVEEWVPPAADVALLKCDVEGGEYHALQGARAILERHHPTIICEVDPWFLEGFGASVARLEDSLAELGYQAYGYEDGKLSPVALAKASFYGRASMNWLFIHPSRLERFSSRLGPDLRPRPDRRGHGAATGPASARS